MAKIKNASIVDGGIGGLPAAPAQCNSGIEVDLVEINQAHSHGSDPGAMRPTPKIPG